MGAPLGVDGLELAVVGGHAGSEPEAAGVGHQKSQVVLGVVGFVVFVVVGIAIVTVHEERIVVIVGIGGTEPPIGNNEVLI